MTIIVKGCNIEYSVNDTFDLSIYAKTGSFSEGSTLQFIIAKSESRAAIVDNTYSMSSDGKFYLSFTETDKAKLVEDDYIYKMILKDLEGKTVTKKSGNFRVKWGA